MGIAADFVLIVVAGLLGGILARLVRLPLLVGYVLAGVFVGPYTAGPTVVETRDIELLAEIGVALLLFSLGLEISLRELQPVKRIAIVGGPIQILVTGAAGALGANWGLGMPWTEAIWFGAMVSVSSTMVVLKILAGEGVLSTLASRIMIGLLVIQDLAVIPMLVILPQLGSPDGLAGKLLSALAVAFMVLVAVVFLGARLMPRLLKQLLKWGSRELFLVAVVAIGVGVGYAVHAVGMSFALGAFVAGLMLSESEFSHQALSDVVPLRDIFGLVFFVSVGMLFDPSYALGNLGTIALVIVTIIAGKAAIIGVITRAFAYGNMAPFIVGLGLSQIGEFSFVLARTGFSGGLLTKPTYDLALTCTVLTMAISPAVSALALPLGRWWQTWRKPAPLPQIDLPRIDRSGHAIVAGFGRSGRAAARALQMAGIPTLVVESNHGALADIRASGLEGLWGDISRREILVASGAERAHILLLTMPNRNTVHLALEQARQLNPKLTVIVRAIREHHIDELLQAGAKSAVQPEFEGGVEMVRQALLSYNQDTSAVARVTGQLRDELYREHGA